MSHNLSKSADGSYQCFTAGKPAWHYLGVNVESAKNWKQVIKLAKMNFTIDKKQLYTQSGNPVNAFGLFRSDTNTFVHSCGPDYTVIQSVDAFNFLDALIDTGDGCHYTSAGVLNNGNIIWCNVAIPEAIRIRGTDDISNVNLLFADYRNGKQATVHNCITRTVCNNTLKLALSENGFFFKFRHTSKVHDKLLHAKEIIVKERAEVKSLEEKLNILARKKATNDVIKNVMEKLFPKIQKSERSRNQARDILERYEINDGDVFPSERGTAFNLLNAITGYVDHDRSVRVGNYDVTVPGIDVEVYKEKMEYQKRAESAMFGTGDNFKNQAMQYILEATETISEMNQKQIFDMQKNAIDSILEKVSV